MEEDKQEEKSKIMFGENERMILATLSRNVKDLTGAVKALTRAINELSYQVLALVKKD